MAGAKGVAFCRACRKPRISLTSTGRLWHHSRYSRAESGEYNTRCDGSGEFPHLVKPTPAVAPAPPVTPSQDTVHP